MGRKTDQRDAIRNVFRRAQRPLTANEVLDRATESVPGLGIATVYRNIKRLHEDGWLIPVDLPGEPSRFELADREHHHHFRCDDCGKVYDIPGCHAPDDHAPAGFQVTRHEVWLFGMCPDCAA